MSSKAAFGSVNGSSLVLYKGYPQLGREGEVWTAIYKYWCQLVLAPSLIPAAYAACELPGHEDLILRDTNITPNGTAGLCDVELIYRPSGISYSIDRKDGDAEQSSVASRLEIPLDDPRLVSSGLLTAAQVKTLIESGHTTYYVGTVEYTYTEYLDTFSWTQAAITDDVGSTQAPTGLTGATASKWMLVGLSIRTSGNLIEKSRTWRYNKLGWTP